MRCWTVSSCMASIKKRKFSAVLVVSPAFRCSNIIKDCHRKAEVELEVCATTERGRERVDKITYGHQHRSNVIIHLVQRVIPSVLRNSHQLMNERMLRYWRRVGRFGREQFVPFTRNKFENKLSATVLPLLQACQGINRIIIKKWIHASLPDGIEESKNRKQCKFVWWHSEPQWEA